MADEKAKVEIDITKTCIKKHKYYMAVWVFQDGVAEVRRFWIDSKPIPWDLEDSENMKVNMP